MIGEYYECYVSGKKTYFAFQSAGPRGVVIKIIRFTYIKENRWNLGFGDYKRGQIDSSSITNNGDVVKVMNTVARAIHVFFEEYPDRIIEIRPVDEKRKRLYNQIFSRKWIQIQDKFVVFGLKNKSAMPYSPFEFYDSFEIMPNFGA
jgi:hypothetical protein